MLLIFGAYDKLLVLPKELWLSRRLIWRLAKNDFRKRYAGSFFGAVWAMVPPVVTVIMYWIVFDKIFGQHTMALASGEELPYVVFLTAGLVPWFFFSDALNSGTCSLLEYNYLVKKVVFKISVLPITRPARSRSTSATCSRSSAYCSRWACGRRRFCGISPDWTDAGS